MEGNAHNDQCAWVQASLNRYEVPLLRFAARLMGDTERARDVVQETFLRLCRESPTDFNGRLPQWLFTVCRNQALDIRRKEGRRNPLEHGRLDAVLVADDCRDTRGAEGFGIGELPDGPTRGRLASEARLESMSPECDPATVAEQREGTSRLKAHLAGLPELQQEVIHLRFQGGLSYKEIAEVSGLSVTYVGYLIHGAIKTLRERLSDAPE